MSFIRNESSHICVPLRTVRDDWEICSDIIFSFAMMCGAWAAWASAPAKPHIQYRDVLLAKLSCAAGGRRVVM